MNMNLNLIYKVRQFYRYYRNVQKYSSLSPKRKEVLEQDIQFYSQFIKKGDLCFDVGANIGDKTEAFLQLGAKVVAVEPQQSCWLFLKRRFRDRDVVIVNKALDKTVGSKEIFVDRSHTLSSMSSAWIDKVRASGRFPKHKWNCKLEIKTTTLDELIDEYGVPDFCKIDVEGYEFEVIQGLSQPLRIISFEFITEFLGPVLDIIGYLTKLGKVEYNYSTNGSALVLPAWVGAEKMIGILLSLRQNPQAHGDIYARIS